MSKNRLEVLESSLTKGIAGALTELRKPNIDEMRAKIATLQVENERLNKNICVRVSGFFRSFRSSR